MKSFQKLSRSLFLGCIALGAVGILAPTLTLAEGKGASKLMFRAPSANVQARAGASSMSCPRCTEGYTKVLDTSAKRTRADSTKLVAIHNCPSCATTITSVGVGKNRADRVNHSCGTTSSCCVTLK